MICPLDRGGWLPDNARSSSGKMGSCWLWREVSEKKGEQRGLPSVDGILINRVVSHAWCVVTAGGLRVARRSDIDTMVAMG